MSFQTGCSINPLEHKTDVKLTMVFCSYVQEPVEVKCDGTKTITYCLEKRGCKGPQAINQHKVCSCLLNKKLAIEPKWVKKKPLILHRKNQIQTTLGAKPQ